MKINKIIYFLVIFVSVFNAQDFNYENEKYLEIESRIQAEVNNIKIIDTHEHLITEKGWLQSKADFFDLFKSYINSDLLSSGMTKQDYDFIFNLDNPLETRWQKFYPFWNKVKNTGYAQSLKIALKDLYGINEINEQNYKLIYNKMQDNHKAGWYKYVLKHKSGIAVSLIDPLERYAKIDSVYPVDFFLKVKRFDDFIRVKKNKIIGLLAKNESEILSFQYYLQLFANQVKSAKEKEHIAAIKSGLAYSRSLFYDEVDSISTEIVFNKYFIQLESVTDDSLKMLQDYLMHFLLKQAAKNNLPVQFHTGILAGNWHLNPIENTNARLLSNLFNKYKDVKFVIFHGNYPYMADLSYLAKSYPNVYIDMCWMDIISPQSAKMYLKEWLLTVPANKIMAFGGDIGSTIEMVYGHSKLARKKVTKVLAELVFQGYYSEQEAKQLAKMLLRTNALELYNIKNLKDHFYIGN